MAATTRPAATEADLLRTPKDGRKYELVDGEIRVSPAGSRHGHVCANLVFRLVGAVKEPGLGYVFDSSTGFRLPGGNIRSPDIAFIGRGRFGLQKAPEGFGDVVPDLAVEVLSPEDRARYVLDKVGEYLQAGVRLVWVVDPKRERAVAYRSLTDVTNLGLDDSLDGGEVLPGFSVRLREVFE
jgi:Uma2 family endonuclease